MRVLVVDDDEAIQRATRRALVLDGHDVVLAADGATAIQCIRDDGPDVVVLDWMLPDLEGIEVVQRLRTAGDDVAVLMVTARGAVSDRVEALDKGADDYLVKPFDVDELLARVRALGRRVTANSTTTVAQTERIVVDDVTLYPDELRAVRGDREFALSVTEAALLEAFMRHPGIVLNRRRLLIEVWDYEFGGRSDNLDVYVSYVRRKLESGGEPRIIDTVRGVGYVLRRAGA